MHKLIGAGLTYLMFLAAGIAAAQTLTQTPSQTRGGLVAPEIVKELAPAGKLRAAINLGNAVLAQGTAEAPRGITVDLARELGRRTGLDVELMTFEAAGKVVEAGERARGTSPSSPSSPCARPRSSSRRPTC